MRQQSYKNFDLLFANPWPKGNNHQLENFLVPIFSEMATRFQYDTNFRHGLPAEIVTKIAVEQFCRDTAFSPHYPPLIGVGAAPIYPNQSIAFSDFTEWFGNTRCVTFFQEGLEPHKVYFEWIWNFPKKEEELIEWAARSQMIAHTVR